MSFLETMACSCPVIASSTSAMAEVIGNVGDYFDPTSADELMVAIENVLIDVFAQKRLDSLEKKERIKSLSWILTAKSTLDLYQENTSSS